MERWRPSDNRTTTNVRPRRECSETTSRRWPARPCRRFVIVT
jgi:hypothetical protein